MNRIKYCRELNKMSQKYVALSVGVSAPMVSQWESGIKKPSNENIVKLASLFGVSTDYLLGHQSSEDTSSFSAEERKLILVFRQLNRTGKNMLLANADAYLSQEVFRQEDSMSSAN